MPNMPRPVTKLSDEQRALLAEFVTAAKKADQAEAQLEAETLAALRAAQAAREAGIPDTALKQASGWSRMKLHRRLGPRRNPATPTEGE